MQVEASQQLVQAFRGLREGLPTGRSAKQSLQAASEQQAEDSEQQDSTPEAGEQFGHNLPENVLRTEHPRHHDDQHSEGAYAQKPRNRKQPRQRRGPGVLFSHPISSLAGQHFSISACQPSVCYQVMSWNEIKVPPPPTRAPN